MAKVSLSKITPIKSVEKKTIQINGTDVEVLQYLGAEEKALLCERVISAAIDPESNYISRSRLKVYGALEIIKTYSNINITEKMMEDAPKTYDILYLNGIYQAVIDAIDQTEYSDLMAKLIEDADHFENYLHSFNGMMRALNLDYNATKIDVDGLTQELANPNNLDTLRQILDKIG